MLEAHSRLWESGKLARHHDVRSTAVLGVAILLCLVLGCSSPPPELRVLETPGLKHGAITGLRFRSEDVGDGALLLTTRNEDTPTSLDDAVYAYDPARGILSLATVDAWNDATGEVGDWCAMVRGIASPPSRLRRRKRKLAADGRTLDTAGNGGTYFWPITPTELPRRTIGERPMALSSDLSIPRWWARTAERPALSRAVYHTGAAARGKRCSVSDNCR